MSPDLTKENMLLFFPSSEKPLSDKEITDFLTSEPLINNDYERIEYAKKWYEKLLTNEVTKKYNTKKEIKQEIKNIDNKYDWWLAHKQAAKTEMDVVYSEMHLEDFIQEKEKLQGRLKYTGVKFDNKNLKRAKQVPISDYLLFNNAGFAKCLWHDEHSPSLHRIEKSNRVYCFGCGKSADVVDVVMELNNCTLPEAIKIILR